MIWSIPGISVGHVTHAEANTGCTVVLADLPMTASGEVRGSAPATREFALLDPVATVSEIDAVVLSGGSAFGLAAGQGAVEALESAGRGFPTPWGAVPIVVGMSLFDLPVGNPDVRPSAADGRLAAEEALASGSQALGRVGAGTGATVGKWRGMDSAVPAGLVGAVESSGDVVVACLVAVNAWGDVLGFADSDEPEPDLTTPPGGDPQDSPLSAEAGPEGSGSNGSQNAAPGTNTTIGVVATNAELNKVGCHHLARGAHDGLARAISPPHASVDGDAFAALSAGEIPASVDLVRWLTVKCVDSAIRSLGA